MAGLVPAIHGHAGKAARALALPMLLTEFGIRRTMDGGDKPRHDKDRGRLADGVPEAGDAALSADPAHSAAGTREKRIDGYPGSSPVKTPDNARNT